MVCQAGAIAREGDTYAWLVRKVVCLSRVVGMSLDAVEKVGESFTEIWLAEKSLCGAGSAAVLLLAGLTGLD